MRQDILTVMWKERKGLLRLQGSRTRTLLTILVAILMVGIVLPLQMGRDWLQDAWPLLAAFLVPLVVVGITVPESFAGERERHTLETLLASRLPDRAILFGKLLFAVACGWGTSLGLLVVSLVAANLIDWTGRFQFYELAVGLGYAVVSLLMSWLIGSLGVLISLRAATVQAASQTLMFAFMLPLLVIQVGPVVLLSVVPNGEAILHRALSVDLASVLMVLTAVLVVLAAALLFAAMARFRRDRLVLD
jgi:ABC-2 type transport system permease protein